jgi:hypothetical protein
MFQGEGEKDFEFKKDETEYKKVEELDLDALAERQKRARNSMTIDPLDDLIKEADADYVREIELLRPPQEGVIILLTSTEILEVREKIRADSDLAKYYEQARKTLTSGKMIRVDRGRIINQMFSEIPTNEPEHRERLVQLIRGVIIHPLL